MRANLRHEEDFVAEAFQAFAHPILGFASVIFPTVVEKSNSAIDSFMNDLNGGRFIGRVAEVVPAEPKGGNGSTGLAKSSQRNRAHR
jgi:hypothetical protein